MLISISLTNDEARQVLNAAHHQGITLEAYVYRAVMEKLTGHGR